MRTDTNSFYDEVNKYHEHFDIAVTLDERTMAPMIEVTDKETGETSTHRLNVTDITDYPKGANSTAVAFLEDLKSRTRNKQMEKLGL